MQPNYAKSPGAHTGLVSAIRDSRLKVLLVDDEEAFRESMSFNLRRKYGAKVRSVGSGLEAVEAMREGEKFDLVFLDIKMHPMNGIETFAELRKIDPSCKIVMMSAHSDCEEWEKAGRLDVEVLEKPIPERTMTQILSHMARR
jgi:CheY-like chemotaxis protein